MPVHANVQCRRVTYFQKHHTAIFVEHSVNIAVSDFGVKRPGKGIYTARRREPRRNFSLVRLRGLCLNVNRDPVGARDAQRADHRGATKIDL